MGVQVADEPGVAVRAVRPAGKPDGDAGRNAEVAEHERHRSREVLAVAGTCLRDEADEWRRDHGRAVRVAEPARDEEPLLEARNRVVRRPGAAGDLVRDLSEGPVRVEVRIGGEQALNPATNFEGGLTREHPAQAGLRLYP